MNKRPKILIFLPFLTRGGAETQGFLLAKGLNERGYEVEVCGFELPLEKCTLINDLAPLGISYFTLPFTMDLMRSRKALPGITLTFARLVKSKAVDVIIPYTWYPNLLSGLVFQFSGLKKCFWNQRNIEDHVPKTWIENLLPLSKLIFVSNSVPGGRFIERRFAIAKSKITIIRNGLSVKKAEHSAEYWTKRLNAEGKTVITMVSNFFQEKDFITVIKGIAIVLKQAPDVMVVFAGGGGSEVGANRAKALVLDLGLADNVKFSGNVHDIQGLLSASHIGLLSSTSEGAPNSIMEYMNAGLAVVATNIEGISNMLGAGYNYLFEVGDAEGFAIKVLELVQDGTIRRQTGSILRQKVQAEYDYDGMVNSYESLIKN